MPEKNSPTTAGAVTSRPSPAVVALDIGGIWLDDCRGHRPSRSDLQTGRNASSAFRSQRHGVAKQRCRSSQRPSSSSHCANCCHCCWLDPGEMLCLPGTTSRHRRGYCWNPARAFAAGARGISAHPSHHHCSLPGCDRSIGRDPLHVHGRTLLARRAVETPCPRSCGHLACQYRRAFPVGSAAGSESLSTAVEPRSALHQFRSVHGRGHVHHRVSRAGQDPDRPRHDAHGVRHSGRELCRRQTM